MKHTTVISIILGFLFIANADAQSYLIKDTKLNLSSSNEFAPAYYKGSIVFSSDRRQDMLTDHVDNDESRMNHLYIAANKNSPGKLFDRTFLSNIHDMSATFSKNGDTAIFARAYEGGTKEKPAHFGLYISVKSGNKWSDPTPLSINNPTYSVSHPSLSPNGTRLYYASNMQNKGNSDIYYVDITNGKLGEPTKLGDKINTKDMEYFPFAATDDILYFASNRSGGKGNYDVYVAYLKDNIVYPLPEPINSEFNDFSLITDPDMQSGYFSSNRGSDNYDIFYFAFDSAKFEDCIESEELELCYSFAEADAESNNNSAIRYIWNMGDGTMLQGSSINHCYRDTGVYIISLSLLDTLTNLEYPDVAIYMFEIEFITAPFIDCPDTLVAGMAFDLKPGNYVEQSELEPKYHWNCGDGKELKGKEGSHIFERPGNYRLNLIIDEKMANSDTTKRMCIFKDVIVIEDSDVGEIKPKGSMDRMELYKLQMKGKTAFEPDGLFFAKQSAAIKVNE